MKEIFCGGITICFSFPLCSFPLTNLRSICLCVVVLVFYLNVCVCFYSQNQRVANMSPQPPPQMLSNPVILMRKKTPSAANRPPPSDKYYQFEFLCGRRLWFPHTHTHTHHIIFQPISVKSTYNMLNV